MDTVRLDLPLPFSQNDIASHHMEEHREKNRYRKATWAEACAQQRPTLDPPEVVRVGALFHVGRLWDDDNRAQAMKWILDCLKQRQTGSLRWRQGLFDLCGYFVDDDPDHLHLEAVPAQSLREGRENRAEIYIRDFS